MRAANEASLEEDDDGDGRHGQWQQRGMATALQKEDNDVGSRWWQRIGGVCNHT